MKLIRLFCMCCLWVIIFTQTTTASTSLVTLNDVQTTIDLESKIETFKAKKNDLNLQQITSPSNSSQFKSNRSSVTNYGYSNTDFWIRFDIKSTSSAEWYLVLDHVVFGEVELFLLPRHSNNTKGLPDNNHSLFLPIKRHRTPLWKLQLPQDQVFSAYLRINNLKEPLILPIKLMTNSVLLEHSLSRYIFFTMILTGAIVLAAYNLFLSFSLQDKSYLVLVLFISLITALIYRNSNIFPSLYDSLIDAKNWYHVSLSLLTLACGSYYLSIINQHTDNLLKSFTKGIALLSIILAVIVFFFYQNTGSFLFLFIPYLFILPILAIRAVMLGHCNISSSTLSMLCLIISVGMYSPLYTGYFPNYPLESFYIGHIGIVLAILLFSLNQADRTRHLRIQAERAEVNNKATHNFLTTMSHELRTPMHTMMSVNELLRTTPLNREQKNYLNSSELASQQMLGLVDDVLDTARLHSSQPALIRKQPFNLHKLLDNIEKMHGIQANKKQLTFRINSEGIAHHTVIGDEKHISQILTNLVANAIKYTHHGKITLAVSTKKETKANNDKHSNNYIRFAIKDTGPGIPVHHHNSLFQPFYQTDSSHSRHKDGAGLGLAISHKLVQQMGGKLQLESSPGQGSCFFFTLNLPVSNKSSPAKTEFDLAKENSSKTPAIETYKKLLPNLKILLVDDGELNLMIGAKLLILQGAEVTPAKSGQEALNALSQHTFDLVLMDVSMPGMDGYQTTRSIRQNPQHQNLPIIALTAHAIEGEKERCLAAGMNEYLSKPFQTDQLLKLTEQYFPSKMNQ